MSPATPLDPSIPWSTASTTTTTTTTTTLTSFRTPYERQLAPHNDLCKILSGKDSAALPIQTEISSIASSSPTPSLPASSRQEQTTNPRRGSTPPPLGLSTSRLTK